MGSATPQSLGAGPSVPHIFGPPIYIRAHSMRNNNQICVAIKLDARKVFTRLMLRRDLFAKPNLLVASCHHSDITHLGLLTVILTKLARK